MQLGKNLITLCERKGWSLAKLARESGVSKATIHGWSTGRSALKLDQLRKVASALETPLYTLLFGESDPFEAPSEDVLRELFSGDVRITLHRIERRRGLPPPVRRGTS